MNTAYLLTGGNIGDRKTLLEQAKLLINQYCGTITDGSGLYETAPWGNTEQAAFLNQALELKTALNARQLIRRILKIERMMGRERKEKYGPRKIDIDILLFNNEVHDISFLKIPHPEMQNRRFVLLPLAEIAPGLMHPILHKSIEQLLKECPDHLEVARFA